MIQDIKNIVHAEFSRPLETDQGCSEYKVAVIGLLAAVSGFSSGREGLSSIS